MNKSKDKIFISWSGDSSKEISLKLKEVLENDIFNQKLECFVSDSDIASGEDWWNKIKDELTSSSLGLIVITKENDRAPWIYYEGGALMGNNVKTIPILFNCRLEVLKNTPLNGKQAVIFHDKKKFMKMISDINKELKILDISPRQLKLIAANAHEKIYNDLQDVFCRLRDRGYFSEKYVYPTEIQTIDRNSVFISAPMNTLNSAQYENQRIYMLEIVDALKKIGFTKVMCPAADIKDKEHFEGKTKCVINNFKNLKQSECFVLIYDIARPSSSLIELGYAIALCKKIVIFYKKELPFLVQKASENIPHVHSVEYKNISMIPQEIFRDKMDLFGKDNESDDDE